MRALQCLAPLAKVIHDKFGIIEGEPHARARHSTTAH
jgi:glyceraldehyde-3-phosphate dehydrogenase/erythrose-4-phosphate dehydrogenase